MLPNRGYSQLCAFLTYTLYNRRSYTIRAGNQARRERAERFRVDWGHPRHRGTPKHSRRVSPHHGKGREREAGTPCPAVAPLLYRSPRKGVTVFCILLDTKARLHATGQRGLLVLTTFDENVLRKPPRYVEIPEMSRDVFSL